MTISDVLLQPDLAAETSLADVLRRLGVPVHLQRGDTICRANDRADVVHIVDSGFVVAVKRTADGLQQNVALYLPNDIVGHDIVSLGAARCDCIAVAPTMAHKVPISVLRETIEGDATQAAAFWRHVAFHGALAQEWLLSLGRRPAYARTAHFLCEIIYRAGRRADGEVISCPLPLTQTEMADTLGLSVVHVNRTLMRLKEEGLIHLRRGHIDVLNWPRFKAAAGFKAGYLNSKV